MGNELFAGFSAIHIKGVSARMKYAVLYRHREAYPIYKMCGFFGVFRSRYYSYVQRMNRPALNQAIIDRIASQQKRCKHTYGYRRMQLWLDKNSCHKNPKTILKLMKSHGLLSEHGYFKLTQDYGITSSMSRRGNPFDNAMAENFFSILKTECIYRQNLKTFHQANYLIDEYIYFYNYERLQTKTGLAKRERSQASL